MDLKEDLKKALTELRKNEARKFELTAALIIILLRFDVKRKEIP